MPIDAGEKERNTEGRSYRGVYFSSTDWTGMDDRKTVHDNLRVASQSASYHSQSPAIHPFV